MTYADIPGYFDFADAYDHAVSQAVDGAVFVELGVYHGKSLIYLADAIRKSGKSIKLYGVDHFRDPSMHVVMANFEACGTGPVTLIASDSARAAGDFDDASVDFLYIDADHSYEAVARDIAAWRPKMKPGATMAGHDRVREGVARAVREAFGDYECVGELSWAVTV